MGSVAVNWRFSALAFLVGAAYMPGIFSPTVMPRWWLIAVLPLAAPMDFRMVNLPVLGCVLAALAWAAVISRFDLDLYFAALLVGVMIAAAGDDNIENVMAWFGWGVVVSVPFCIAQFFGSPLVQQTSAPAGLFLNSEVFAETAAPVLVWALWRGRWILASFLCVPLILCHSRVAILVTAAGLLFGWSPRRRWIRPAVIMGVAFFAAASVVTIGMDKMVSAMTRIILWLAAVQSVTIGGSGLGSWAAGHPGQFEEFVHSDALQAAVEIGAGSLFFFAVALLLIRRAGPRAEVSAFVAICVEATVSFPLHLPASGFFAAVLAGSLARDRRGICGHELAGRTRLVAAS